MTSSEFQNSPSQQQASVTNIRLMGLDSAKTEYALLVKFTALLAQAKTQTRSQPTPWSPGHNTCVSAPLSAPTYYIYLRD